MIVSINPQPDRAEFDRLISLSLGELGILAQNPTNSLLNLAGRNLEPIVRDVLAEKAVGSPFEGSIELIGGQRFPDIIANRYYGIEVKTTTQNHWRTTGNSVFEGTRIDGIERIFMLFAKLASPVEFRCRPYEEVLSEVVVTHSPRYLIDMNLEPGRTVFDKISVPYDALRMMENPIRPIVDYYRTQLKPGEELWWMDQSSEPEAANLVIRIWNNLSTTERQKLRDKATAFFPIQFSNKPTKYSRMAIWLVTREGVVCPNIRDMFSAGGQGDLTIEGRQFRQVPRIALNLLNRLDQIWKQVAETSASQLSEYWEIPTTEETKFADWAGLVDEYFSYKLDGIRLSDLLLARRKG